MADAGGVNTGYQGRSIDPSVLEPKNDGKDNPTQGADAAREANKAKLLALADKLGLDRQSLFLTTSESPEGGALAAPVINIPKDFSQYSATELTLIVTAFLSAVTGEAVENEKIGLQDRAQKASDNADKVQAKLEEAQKKLDEADKLGIWLQIASAILTLIVTIVSVVATIATFGGAAQER